MIVGVVFCVIIFVAIIIVAVTITYLTMTRCRFPLTGNLPAQYRYDLLICRSSLLNELADRLRRRAEPDPP